MHDFLHTHSQHSVMCSTYNTIYCVFLLTFLRHCSEYVTICMRAHAAWSLADTFCISRGAIAMIKPRPQPGASPHTNMAASVKAVKAQLKAAKAAVGKKDYNEVSRICQVVLTRCILLDCHSYTATCQAHADNSMQNCKLFAGFTLSP